MRNCFHIKATILLKISKFADYSTVILHALAKAKGQLCSTSELAVRTGLSVHTVSKIAKLLQGADLLISTRGAQGGYQLAKLPEEITLAEVVSAIDGSPAMTQCSQQHHECHIAYGCELQGHWQWINEQILNVLAQVTLASLLKKPLRISHE